MGAEKGELGRGCPAFSVGTVCQTSETQRLTCCDDRRSGHAPEGEKRVLSVRSPEISTSSPADGLQHLYNLSLWYNILDLPKNILGLSYNILDLPKNILSLSYNILGLPKNILDLSHDIRPSLLPIPR
jgi:hypothetical protein